MQPNKLMLVSRSVRVMTDCVICVIQANLLNDCNVIVVLQVLVIDTFISFFYVLPDIFK